jgi:hypothetical protein
VAEAGGAFNGQTITGIGIAKAAQVYYEVETHLLTSGSDYQDLYDYLPRACQNLIGFNGITSADCDQVRKAVIATEMNLTPATFRPEAPICSVAGVQPTNLFFDNMENVASGNWSFAASVGNNAWSYSTFPYNTSGTHHLEGADLPTTSDSTATMTSSITLPANAFMHFRHYFYFDFDNTGNYDGGVLEYSTNGGGSWTDAGSLFDTNGYTGTLKAGTANPLTGRNAFTPYNIVYYSSRLNLSSLAGQSVRFRFRVGSDDVFGSDGWWIDDVRIYTCGTTTSTALTSSPNPSIAGQGVTFTATVTSGGGVPGGSVSFYDSNALLGTGTLNGSGIATYITTSLTVGTHSIKAVYAGNTSFVGSTSDTLTQTVNANPCNTTVTSNLDDGNCGTFRRAVESANAPGAPVKTVDATALENTPISLSGTGIVVGPGVTINGPPCTASGPTLNIQGGGITGDGLTLNGATIKNLKISGFNGRQILANGTHNVLVCVNTSRT